MFKKILLIFLFLTSISSGEELGLGYGIGIFNSADHYVGQVKIFNLTYREVLWEGIYTQYRAGLFADGSPEQDRHSSLYTSVGLGLLVNLQPLEIRTGWGLAAISSPDVYLGGVFPEFNGELYIGLRDRIGSGIGIQYEHISSAGIFNPNVGRDFVSLQLSQKW